MRHRAAMETFRRIAGKQRFYDSTEVFRKGTGQQKSGTQPDARAFDLRFLHFY